MNGTRTVPRVILPDQVPRQNHGLFRRKPAAEAVLVAVVLTAGGFVASQDASARVTRLDITSRETTFDGRLFGANGSVGAYEKLRGRAYGELDPADPHNALIVDIALAPRNSRGMVEYAMDVYLLKPVDLSKGNHRMFMEINNRGNKLFGPFNGSAGGNNPSSAADAGDAFLMNRGYTLAWNGWDPAAAAGGDRLTISLPVATNANGTPITGPAYEYIVSDNATTQTYALSYAAASADKSTARLTARDRLGDTPMEIPPSGWTFTDASNGAIRLLPSGTAFKQSAIYEFTYVAKDPVVAGIGFAATRDFVSFLRSSATDDVGNANPLAGDLKATLGYTVSQPARYVNDFIWLGFNEDEYGRKVFDGIENWIGAGTGVAANVRFAQTPRTERNRQNHLYPEAFFPFAFNTTYDSVSGKVDGRGARCSMTGTCPKVLHVNSSNEYWVKAGSLLHTDTRGRDLPDPDNMRFYLLAGMEHTTTGSPPDSPGICAQPRNVNNPSPALRALFVALDEWVTRGVKPPKSEVPRRSEGNVAFVEATGAGSLVGTGVVPQHKLGWPDIPGVLYDGLVTARNQFDWGPHFDQGILSINPPQPTGATYRHFVSKVDRDGNEVAGIQLPPVAVPTATLTGWAHRASAFGGPDGCESSGQTIVFAKTKAERRASGDPRESLEERYRSHDRYVDKVSIAVRKLEMKRFLLPEDADRYVREAEDSDVLIDVEKPRHGRKY